MKNKPNNTPHTLQSLLLLCHFGLTNSTWTWPHIIAGNQSQHIDHLIRKGGDPYNPRYEIRLPCHLVKHDWGQKERALIHVGARKTHQCECYFYFIHTIHIAGITTLAWWPTMLREKKKKKQGIIRLPTLGGCIPSYILHTRVFGTY